MVYEAAVIDAQPSTHHADERLRADDRPFGLGSTSGRGASRGPLVADTFRQDPEPPDDVEESVSHRPQWWI